MIGVGRRRGNYAYATARVKAKKSLLLTKDNYPKLLMMDLNEIGRFLGETQYKVEMTELGSRFSGVNLIELGTYKNLARTYRTIISFCSGELRDIVAAYLRRWDVWNVKTIIRGKYSNASLEDIQEDLVPAGTMSEEYLKTLIAMDNPMDILAALGKKGELSVPDDVIATFEKTGSVAPVEDYLDKVYYTQLLETIRPTNKPKTLFLSFVKREIDVANLRTLLKLKQAGLPLDKIRPYFIEGGHYLDVKELTRLASMETFDQMVDDLSKLPFFEDIKEPLEKAKKNGSLNDVMLNLQRYLAKESEKFSHLYPLSVLPIIDYIIRKKIEVDNIRVIARGKASGLEPDVIKNLLVM
jgi:V/A-type H+-transporting ATPase subunit C